MYITQESPLRPLQPPPNRPDLAGMTLSPEAYEVAELVGNGGREVHLDPTEITRKAVIIVRKGGRMEVFESRADAARKLGVSPSRMCQLCHRGWWKGMRFITGGAA